MDFLRNLGDIGLFIHAMIDAIIFPIPALFSQLSLSALSPDRAIWLATIGFVGCLIGTPIGYGIGKVSGNLVLTKIMKKKWYDSATTLFTKHGEAAILVGAFTPIPFKIFTILSGCMSYPLWKLLSYAALGRAVKFYTVGILFYVYGRAAEHMVDGVLTIILLSVGALIGGIWLTVRLIKNRKKKRAEVPVVQGPPESTDVTAGEE
ncbi:MULTISPECIES: VTT domain-containing protein [Paenibacillus]|uniref:YqaA family protein n=1 Tax=Paenibacillus TaxID=44249 RepID=UPI00188CEC62|nr:MULTISPECIES: VTT domain-containing protein [Paenibacillus]MBX4147970.1 VTT domain-containing protein [Paenibacillus lautus]MCT1399057.1 VTT domain-containing protein [Paenibacillus sp. p3-SID867]